MTEVSQHFRSRMATLRSFTSILHSQKRSTLLTALRYSSPTPHLLLPTTTLQSIPSRARPISTSTTNKMPSSTSASGDTISNSKQQSASGANHDWKHNPPYRIHDNGDNFPVKHEASCHCGRVKYRLRREKPLAAKYCHCTTCQTIHGAPFQWAAIFQKDDIDFSDGLFILSSLVGRRIMLTQRRCVGVHGLEWYESSHKSTEHTLPCKVRCGYCGTWIMDEGRNMILLFPTLIHFKSKEAREEFAPTCHMFYPQRVVDIKDGRDKWSGLDGSSELLNEEGEKREEEAGNKRKRGSGEEENL
jgi:hypothetical protein